MLIQVDKNDSYGIQYSINGSNRYNRFSISAGAGSFIYGMDTFTHDDIAFTSVDAGYVRTFATGGDHAYAISEFYFQQYSEPFCRRVFRPDQRN